MKELTLDELTTLNGGAMTHQGGQQADAGDQQIGGVLEEDGREPGGERRKKYARRTF